MSYWPSTTSPLCRRGRNENGVPSLGQKPSMRPARPSRLRPTGSPHFAQNRRSSGNVGSSRTSSVGSGTTAGAIATSPAPRRWDAPPEVRVVPVLVRLVPGPLDVVDDGIDSCADGIDGMDGTDGIDGIDGLPV